LPNRIPLRARKRAKEPRPRSAGRVHARFAVLLRRRQVEQEIRGDERARWLVVEDDFFVGVGGHVFPVEFGVEFGRDGLNGLRLPEHKRKGNRFILLLFALLGQRFGTDDLGVGVGLVPGAKEDVVLWLASVPCQRSLGGRNPHLGIKCCDVPDFAQCGDLALDVFGQRDWGEDGESARLQAHDGAATTDLDFAKPQKGEREGRDHIGDNVTDDHDLGWIGRY